MNPSSSRSFGGGICVAIAAQNTQSAIKAVQPVVSQVDVVEIRLDGMQDVDIPTLSDKIERPLLFTNRAEWEGGNFSGSEEERMQPLLEAIENEAAYIDLELKSSPEHRRQLLEAIQTKEQNTRMIVSHHNFSSTPDSASLSDILHQQIESGAHIGKIVTMAHNHLDVLRVLNLQEEASINNFPLIAFCMGEPGKISRIVTLLLGGFMTYAALDEQQATAPGQLSVEKILINLATLSYKEVD